MDTDALVRDYLGRLDAAAARLPAYRRVELVGEVRDHIDAAVAEAGRSDEVTVRNVLERLGTPEEILAGEPGATRAPRAASGASSQWGAAEVAALVLIGLAWPAMFLPFGLVLWLGFGVLGLMLVWVSSLWSMRRKLITTAVVAGPYAAVFILFFIQIHP